MYSIVLAVDLSDFCHSYCVNIKLGCSLLKQGVLCLIRNRSTTLPGQICFSHSVIFYVPFCAADNLIHIDTLYPKFHKHIKQNQVHWRVVFIYIGQKPGSVMEIELTFFRVSTGDQIGFHVVYMASQNIYACFLSHPQ